MAGFDLDDLDRLLGLLREHPERQAQLRSLAADEAVARLSSAIERLTQAQGDTEQRVAGLAGRVDALAQAQQATERRIDALAQAQQATERRIDALAQAQQRTEEQLARLGSRVDQLVQAIQALTEQMSAVVGYVDWLRGDVIERRYRERPHTYLHTVARRMHLLSARELDDLLEPAVDSGLLTADEAGEIRAADGVFEGRRVSDRADVYVVLEASFGVGLGDVQRARQRADLLGRLGVDTMAVVGGTWIAPEAAEAARAYGVWQVSDGRLSSPAA
ncbi:MAG TPA: hypothetical protein VG452_09095 [Egibacteraceae bacterium]|nr:hypothetical protein [Egibacteraceae bacterium]